MDDEHVPPYVITIYDVLFRLIITCPSAQEQVLRHKRYVAKPAGGPRAVWLSLLVRVMLVQQRVCSHEKLGTYFVKTALKY